MALRTHSLSSSGGFWFVFLDAIIVTLFLLFVNEMQRVTAKRCASTGVFCCVLEIGKCLGILFNCLTVNLKKRKKEEDETT